MLKLMSWVKRKFTFLVSCKNQSYGFNLTLASELSGQLLIHTTGLSDAIAYKQAGANVFMYFFDFEAPVDKFTPYSLGFLLGTKEYITY